MASFTGIGELGKEINIGSTTTGEEPREESTAWLLLIENRIVKEWNIKESMAWLLLMENRIVKEWTVKESMAWLLLIEEESAVDLAVMVMSMKEVESAVEVNKEAVKDARV